MKGYWEPHSSSIDFCEPNYYLTAYLAETHNTWSSLVITAMALVGLIYGNPTGDWSVAVMFGVLGSIGIGSAGLHGTMHWFLQSADEIPMLWQTLSFLEVLVRLQAGGENSPTRTRIGVFFLFVAVAQTIFYFRFQNVYSVFLLSMIAYSAAVIIGTALLLRENIAADQYTIRWVLWKWALINYVVFGFGLWLADFHLCNHLLFAYKSLGGFTLHVFWHIFAGLGSYFIATFLTAVNLQKIGRKVRLRWIGQVLPICEITKNKD